MVNDMKNKNGYTIIELVIVLAVVGVFGFALLNKASYAFSDNAKAEENLLAQKVKNIEMQAEKYGEDHQELFEENNTAYIRVSDLIKAGYIRSQESNDVVVSINDNKKIELKLKDDKVIAKLEI